MEHPQEIGRDGTELKQRKVKGHKFAKSFFLNAQKGLPE